MTDMQQRVHYVFFFIENQCAKFQISKLKYWKNFFLAVDLLTIHFFLYFFCERFCSKVLVAMSCFWTDLCLILIVNPAQIDILYGVLSRWNAFLDKPPSHFNCPGSLLKFTSSLLFIYFWGVKDSSENIFCVPNLVFLRFAPIKKWFQKSLKPLKKIGQSLDVPESSRSPLYC